MTQSEQSELEVLKVRFPHIQEIHGDSMDMSMFSGILLAAALVVASSVVPLDFWEQAREALKHQWNQTSNTAASLKLAGAAALMALSSHFYRKSKEEDWAIQRYFSLLKKEKQAAS